MSKVVVLGLEGETGLWVADFETGTIAAVSSASADDMRKSGKLTPRGVSFAMVAETAAPLSGGYMDK